MARKSHLSPVVDDDRAIGSPEPDDDLSPRIPRQCATTCERLTRRSTVMFSILGNIEVWNGWRTVEIRGSAQRALLGALISAESHPVSPATLIDELWGDFIPSGVENALHAHVSRLRRKLRAVSGQESGGIDKVPPGYRLEISPENLDAGRFLTLLNAARDGVKTNPPEDTADGLREALALWRGPVFGYPPRGPRCQAAAARYEAARTMAREMLFDVELALGRHADITPELVDLTEGAPLNEKFCAQLMLALYRCGRQADALAAYYRARDRFDSELGIEPSPNLRRYELAILQHDPNLFRYEVSEL